MCSVWTQFTGSRLIAGRLGAKTPEISISKLLADLAQVPSLLHNS